MKITRSNYELFFLDFIEGKLDNSLKSDLQQFLLLNPDLAIELDEMKEASKFIFHAEPIVFQQKESLKKNWNSIVTTDVDSFNERCISKLEGNLTAQQDAEFEAEIENNQQKKKEYQLFTKTIVKPDFSIVYLHKASLKKFVISQFVKENIFTISSIAASITIILMVYNIYFTKSEIVSPKFAQNSVLQKTNESKQLAENAAKNESLQKPSKNISHKALINNERESVLQNISAKKIAELPYKNTLKHAEPELKQNNAFLSEKISGIVTSQFSQKPVNLPVENNNNNFETPKQMITNFINKKILKKSENEEQLNFWNIANAGAKEINNLTGMNVALHRICRDENCKVITYAIGAGELEISFNVKK